MKIGDKVAVLYDGKLCRGTEGIVTGTRQQSRIRVKFAAWTDDKVMEVWFPRRRRATRWGGKRVTYSRIIPGLDTLMDKLFGFGGDWYSMCKITDLSPSYQALVTPFKNQTGVDLL